MSSAYKDRVGEDTLLCENIREAKVSGNQVTLIDIMGYTVTVDGAIKQIDLVNNVMLIESA